jgi:class 3 adenylate cyclase
LTALGDTVNVAARLASSAGTGEILVTEAAAANADLQSLAIERRTLSLKGKSEPFDVRVLRRSTFGS